MSYDIMSYDIMHTKCDTDTDSRVNVCERDNEHCVCSSELPATCANNIATECKVHYSTRVNRKQKLVNMHLESMELHLA